MKPHEFFEELLPELWQSSGVQQSPGWGDLEADLLYEVSGPDGGRWHLSVTQGRLEVGHHCKHPPLLLIHQSYDAWERGFPEGDWRERLHTRMNPSLARIQPHKLSLLRRLRGAFSVHLEGAAGEEAASSRVEINPPIDDAPSFELRLGLEDYRKLQRNTLRVEEAFLAGKIRLKGDSDFAMQLAAVVLSA